MPEYVNICNRESLKTQGKGKSRVYLKKRNKVDMRYPLHILAHRDDFVVASANKSSTRARSEFFIYDIRNYTYIYICGYI